MTDSAYERLRTRLDHDEHCLARALFYANEADEWRCMATTAIDRDKCIQEAEWSERKADQALMDWRKALERREG